MSNARRRVPVYAGRLRSLLVRDRRAPQAILNRLPSTGHRRSLDYDLIYALNL